MKIESNFNHYGKQEMNRNTNGQFHTFLNPTGKQSGDAFYRQHQHHLQQSELQFSIAHQHSESFTGLILQNTENRSPDFLQLQSNIIARQTPPQKNLQTSQNEIFRKREMENKQPKVIHSIFESIPIRKYRADYTNLLLSKMRHRYLRMALKKYRLCIIKNEAELTIRIKQSDRKNAMTLIRKYLSERKLNLRKIIINGVTQ